MQENKQLSKEERKNIRKEKEEEAKKLRLSIEKQDDNNVLHQFYNSNNHVGYDSSASSIFLNIHPS